MGSSAASLPPVSKPSALVFDFDGTMIDTESIEYASLSALWQKYGRVLPYGDWAKYLGTDAPDWVEALVWEHPDDLNPDRLRSELDRDQVSRTAQAELLPGILAIVAAARAEHVPLGIASNSPSERLFAELERRNLTRLFGVVITRDQISRGKPDPDAYTTAAAILGVNPHQAVAFEDSAPGMRAALGAGYRCVVAPTPATRHHSFTEAHLQVSSLDQLSVPDLMEGRLSIRAT